ncbi:hypothetical protein O6H91_08G103000 [Diphasiastrum complanatum]|uniref:Uncharacterized protein n=1 Tax=Diphasiastrum complanatum TaxID=34168 RepID=A0ACC2D0H0_DIPCM|nr:hypothetical protein O6H91_08G103000 [Diphasiastrum complanatum]
MVCYPFPSCELSCPLSPSHLSSPLFLFPFSSLPSSSPLPPSSSVPSVAPYCLPLVAPALQAPPLVLLPSCYPLSLVRFPPLGPPAPRFSPSHGSPISYASVAAPTHCFSTSFSSTVSFNGSVGSSGSTPSTTCCGQLFSQQGLPASATPSASAASSHPAGHPLCASSSYTNCQAGKQAKAQNRAPSSGTETPSYAPCGVTSSAAGCSIGRFAF